MERGSARVAVVGGGISGLSSALALQDRGLAVTLFEARQRPGGVVYSEQASGFVFEGGPDSVLSAKPATLQLIDRLGMTDRLISTRPDGGETYILHKGKLVPLPQGLSMLVPARMSQIASTPLLSPLGKLRMALEYVVPVRRDDADESVGEFVRRRLGRQVLEHLAEPLLAGIYAGDADRLSLAATFPRLRDVELTHGGIIKGVLAEKHRRNGAPDAATASRHTPFVSLAGGLGELVEGLSHALSSSEVRTGEAVRSLEPCGDGYRLMLADGQRLEFDAVVLAIPAPAAADLVEPLSPDLTGALREIYCVSPVTVSVAFDERDIGGRESGRGFVIPRSEGRALTAVTWSSNKFAGRAPAGVALLRAFLGKAGYEEPASLSDDRVLSLVLDELASILGITAPPLEWRVYRWQNALPQYTVGHYERVARINALAAEMPRLALAGSAYQGIGIPDCIRFANEQAQKLVDGLYADQPGARHTTRVTA